MDNYMPTYLAASYQLLLAIFDDIDICKINF